MTVLHFCQEGEADGQSQPLTLKRLGTEAISLAAIVTNVLYAWPADECEPPAMAAGSVATNSCWPAGSTSQLSSGALPAAPEHALPPLASLTKSTPSPLLQWQLLDIMYSYALVMRLYNGDYSSDAQVSCS